MQKGPCRERRPESERAMLRRLKRRAAIVLLLLSCCGTSAATGCAARVQYVPVVMNTCHPGPAPELPALTAEPCGEFVCLTPDSATAIWLYVRDVQRYAERANLCADVGEEPEIRTFPGVPQ